MCGTKLYVAPEIIRLNDDQFQGQCTETYDSKVDMWSLGVILYIILTGSPPFDENCPGKNVEEQICDGDFLLPSSLWAGVSFEAKDLVNHLLVVNSQKRYNCDQTKKHDWLMDPEILEKVDEIYTKEKLRIELLCQEKM